MRLPLCIYIIFSSSFSSNRLSLFLFICEAIYLILCIRSCCYACICLMLLLRFSFFFLSPLNSSSSSMSFICARFWRELVRDFFRESNLKCPNWNCNEFAMRFRFFYYFVFFFVCMQCVARTVCTRQPSTHIDIRMDGWIDASVWPCDSGAYSRCACWLEINFDSLTDTPSMWISALFFRFSSLSYTHTHLFSVLFVLTVGTACHCFQFTMIRLTVAVVAVFLVLFFCADMQTTNCAWFLFGYRMFLFSSWRCVRLAISAVVVLEQKKNRTPMPIYQTNLKNNNTLPIGKKIPNTDSPS